MGTGSQAGLILASVFTGLMPYHLQAATCDTSRVDLRGEWGQASFAVELADEPEERAQGLMNRPEMSTDAGMLFVYPEPKPVAFWMKNTLIPLDMIFIDERGIVTYIHHDAIPHDERPVFGGDAVKAVLEINAGLSKELGLDVGSQIRHPSLDVRDTAWPCNNKD